MPRLAGFATDCAIRFDGEEIPARTGEPVASALLAADRVALSRSPKYHRTRGAFCLAGSCGGCLLRVDGLPNRPACRTACRDGLAVESQNAFPGPRHDLLGLIDVATPRGLDHHRLATFSLAANRAAVALARRLGGGGRLPDVAAARTIPPGAGEERFDALVVGAGPAGLAAAAALAEAGRRVLLAERDARVGGRLRARQGRSGDPDLAWASATAERVRLAGGEVATGAAVAGLWRDGGAPLALLHDHAPVPRVRLVRAARVVLCTGGHPQPLAIPGADRAGVHAARGLAVLLAEHGVLPGARVAIVGETDDGEALAERLAAARVDVERIVSAAGARVAGRARAAALVLPSRRIRCDAIAAATPIAPALELGRALGAGAVFDAALGAFALRTAADGATGVPGVLAAGEVTGAASAGRAAEAGRRAGEAARG